MANIQSTIHVSVDYFTGQDEGDVGYPYYVASCKEITATTDGRTLDELLANVREVIDLMPADEEPSETYGLVPTPRVVLTLELPNNAETTD